MVIHNLDVESVGFLPAEANAPLVVDSDRMLPLSGAFERLQPIAGQAAEILEKRGRVEYGW